MPETNPDLPQWTVIVKRDTTVHKLNEFGAQDEVFLFRIQGEEGDSSASSYLNLWIRRCKLMVLEHDLKKWQENPGYFNSKPEIDFYSTFVASRGFPTITRLPSPESKVSESAMYDIAEIIERRYQPLPNPTETKEI